MLVPLIDSFANGKLGDSLEKIAILSNFNAPGIVNDQLGGFMSGGSIHTKNRVQDVQVFNIQTPSLNASCGGIDLFMDVVI